MAIRTNRFIGTPGTSVTVANSAAGGDPFDLMNPTTPSGFVYSNARVNPITGGTIARVSGAAAVANEARWNPTDGQVGKAQVVFWSTAAPTTASNDFLTIRGTRQNAGMRDHTGGQFRVLNLGSEIGGAGAVSGLRGAWAVLDMVVVEGTTSSNGTIKFQFRWLSDLSTVVSSYTSSARDAGVIGTDVINSLRFGKTTTGSVLADFDIAWVAGEVLPDASVAGATDYLPNPGGNVAPIATLSAFPNTDVEPGTTVTLTLGGSDSDGTIASSSLTQTSGPTVTLSGSGSTRTYVAPYTSAGTSTGFSYTVTDDDGTTSDPATVTVSILRATEFYVTTGGASPVKVPMATRFVD
jgi:hypothetical protein